MNYFKHETAVIDSGCFIGSGTKIWHFSHIMINSKIGEKCNIGQNVVISSGVELGNNVKIQNNVSVYTGVICEDDVFLGPSCVFTNIKNPRSAVNRKDQYQSTIIGKGASIGANATIICGNNIGCYAFIGAGSVVTKSVLPYALVIGNPAKQIGWVSEFGQRLIFDEENKAICNESNDVYELVNNKIVKKL
jgi:UDP-2-acetamido-3-amino-2,3-dideoxy-glucuronate N-acetyltransferase